MTDPRRWGVEVGFHDALGRWRDPAEGVVDAVLAAMGAEGEGDPLRDTPIITVRLDHELPPIPAGTLHTEDGGSIRIDGQLPADLPAGYHLLEPIDASPLPLIASPGRCPNPAATRSWGWSAQLYATRSRSSWGIGDLEDLRLVAQWCSDLGGSITLLNPLHGVAPMAHQQSSPYFAASRCFANPIYLRIENIAGCETLSNLDALATAGRSLNSARLIDRDRVWALKSAALEELFEGFSGDAGFDAFCQERGGALDGWATFCALAEIYGVPWQAWPEDLATPSSTGVREFATAGEGPRRIRYYKWLQWHLDAQLAAASSAGGLMQDLAIGVDAGGADAWIWQDTFAAGTRVGAPPDEFNTLGQDWGLPPWDPWKLRRSGYVPFIETVRAGLRHAGGLRFDHVMGLFRLYWIPEGRSAAEGAYVRYPYWDLLNILALEASRAGAFVVGEDLGTVEDHVREELATRQILSYRLLWFEPEKPGTWPHQALGAVSTHDLPTVAGVWSGSDLATQERLELSPNVEASVALRRRLEDWTAVASDAPAEEVIDAAYGLLADAPCALVTASLDDALGVEERPNMPGTVEGWPNWSIALPLPIEEIERSPLATSIASHLRDRTSHNRHYDL